MQILKGKKILICALALEVKIAKKCNFLRVKNSALEVEVWQNFSANFFR